MNPHQELTAAGWIGAALRSGEAVTDAAFDALLPKKPRGRSSRFWTPVEAATVASEWVRQLGARRLLDVGAGAGKLCAIASLRLDRRVYGIEQRPHLAAIARELASSLGADVEILDGTFDQISVSDFDALYFYNPLAEHVSGSRDHYDEEVTFSDRRYFEDVGTIESWLGAARVGTAMITYHGLGGRIPESWKVEREQRIGSDLLRLWVKRAAVAADFYLELGDTLQTGTHLRALLSRLKVSEKDSPLITGLAKNTVRRSSPRPPPCGVRRPWPRRGAGRLP